MKRVLLLTGAALALAACSRGEATETTIETAAVERRDIIVDAQATGVVEPINIVEVKSKSSGQIVQMPVEVGSEVAHGDLLVQTPDARVAAWSTDPRAGVPHLPDLHPDLPLPTCVLTLVGGEVAFEEPGALT